MIFIPFAIPVQVQTATPTSPQEDISTLSLDFDTFDQTPAKGWRPLSNAEKYLEAAKLIDRYLDKHTELDSSQIIMLRFHAAQMYAFDDKTDIALKYLSNTEYPVSILKSVPADLKQNLQAWNTYVQATIAFLRRDKDTLQSLRLLIAKGPIIDGAPMNLDVVDRLLSNFDKPYKNAYFQRTAP